MGINAYNSSEIIIVDSIIFDQNSHSFILSNSNITLLNVSLKTNNIQFLDTNSELIFEWFLHVQTKDQINDPIKGIAVIIVDNENGTYCIILN